MRARPAATTVDSTPPPTDEPVAPPTLDFRREADVEKNFKAQGFKQGDLVFVRVPFASNSDDFILADRNIGMVAARFGIGVMLFDEKSSWDALVLDASALSMLGLMRAPT